MTQVVIALCLFISGELVEHRIQSSMSDCLKKKRVASRNMDMNDKRLMCGEVEAELEKNIDGSISIGKIIKAK